MSSSIKVLSLPVQPPPSCHISTIINIRNLSSIVLFQDIQCAIPYVLVNAPVRVHYGKYCTRGVSRGPIQHEAKPSAVLALETRPECNISRSARA